MFVDEGRVIIYQKNVRLYILCENTMSFQIYFYTYILQNNYKSQFVLE